MTDHPKPVARYAAAGPMLPVKQDKAHVMKTFILDADHEAAIAAEREQYEARIAELERHRDQWSEGAVDTFDDLRALRAAIEAKAREWNEQADVASVMSGDPDTAARVEAWRQAASELRALLKKKP